MKTLTLLIGITIILVGYSHDSQSATEAKDAADTVYTNGKIYTVNEAQPADMFVLDQNLWGANSYSSHKCERFPSLVICDALVTMNQ